jgi:hypothetical protein
MWGLGGHNDTGIIEIFVLHQPFIYIADLDSICYAQSQYLQVNTIGENLLQQCWCCMVNRHKSEGKMRNLGQTLDTDSRAPKYPTVEQFKMCYFAE